MKLFEKLGLISTTEEPVSQKQEEASPISHHQAQPHNREKAVNTVKSNLGVTSDSNITPPLTSGQIDLEIYEKLTDVITSNNLEGNDFLEFMESINKLNHLTVDESVKFNMVFATLSTASDKLTRQGLLSSIDHYLNVLDQEKKVFYTEVNNIKEERVHGKQDKINAKTKEIKEKEALLLSLQNEIVERTLEIQALEKEISDSNNAISSRKQDFEHTYSQMLEQILQYKSKIVSYIQ